jgi:hypothetical protein
MVGYEYVLCQLVTIAKFRKPRNPTTCDVKRFHLWRWREGLKREDGGMVRPPKGMKCQCGLLTE